MPYKRLKNIRILLIDDEVLVLRLVTDVLAHLGFTDVTTAETGSDALALICAHEYDIVITDWRIPDCEGIDLIKFIRTSEQCSYPQVPIILLTGNTGTNYILRARDAGVTEYMIKPFSAQQLVRRIKSIVEKPRPFVEAPSYFGPNRRFHNSVTLDVIDRRQELAA